MYNTFGRMCLGSISNLWYAHDIAIRLEAKDNRTNKQYKESKRKYLRGS